MNKDLFAGLFDHPYENIEDAYKVWACLSDQNSAFDGTPHSWKVRDKERYSLMIQKNLFRLEMMRV